MLGIPCIIDRLIQQAISQILLPLFDPYFSEKSYGFRPEHSQHMAIKQVEEYVKEGYKIAIDVDLSKFFDTINHDYLMSILGRRIRDKALLKLIGKFLRAGILDKGKFIESREGVPQGSPLSPLLSNIILDYLDKELEKRGHKFARYADDFVILVKSKRSGERVMKSITRFVEKRLKLRVNGQKSKVVSVEESKFLGFTFKGIGVSQKLAISCGASSKGYWRGAKTEGIQIALNNKLLKEQGLVSLKDIWISLRYG
jgi:RNA-directed DNA polymerase